MDKYIKLQKYSDKLLSQHHITINTKDKYKVAKQLSLYLDGVIFNIISIFCLISIINESNKITDKTMQVGRKYIEDTCSFSYSMSGGSRLGCASLLGQTEPMYSASNPTNDILKVNFEAGIARPQIGGNNLQSELHNIVAKYIKEILLYHNVTASKSIKSEIASIINFHLDCFISYLKNHSGTLTLTALKKIVKEHKILHPLK